MLIPRRHQKEEGLARRVIRLAEAAGVRLRLLCFSSETGACRREDLAAILIQGLVTSIARAL